MPDPVPTRDRAAVLAFITRAQSDPATATTYLGEDAADIESELEGLDQPWLETVRVVTEAGDVVGAAAVEWDAEVGRAWVYGPWATPTDFGEIGEPLLRSVAAQCPPAITEFEVTGDLRHTGMAALAERLGWRPTKVNHAMEIGVDAVRAWPSGEGVRDATEADLPAIAALHESTFPGAYATSPQLLTRHVTLVAERDACVVGYASGQLQDDGQAYIDFMAVDPARRGEGLGRQLFGALAHRLVASGAPAKLHLTVEDERVPARRLYESMGMTRAISLRGYRGELDRQDG